MRLNCIFHMFLTFLGSMSLAEKFQYFSTEHPKITFLNSKYEYISYANMTSQRFGRNDRFYYVVIHVHVNVPMSNNVTGEYHFYNMTIPLKSIPLHFPFSRGRIYANVTLTDSNELISAAHIDMEIKEVNTRKKKIN